MAWPYRTDRAEADGAGPEEPGWDTTVRSDK
jgi:hypothetical protein